MESYYIMAWQHQKELLEDDIPKYQEIVNIARSIGDIRDRCLFILAYLTGGRISELVTYRKVTYKTKEVMVHGRPKVLYDWSSNTKGDAVYGIRPKDISYIKEAGMDTLLIKIRNLKNKKKTIKRIPINPEKESMLISLFLPYVKSMPEDHPVFPFSNNYAWMLLRKYGYNPHYLRHIRLTHLVQIYGYTDQELKEFAGWTDSRPATNYIKLNWSDLRRKMS
jgi:integrase